MNKGDSSLNSFIIKSGIEERSNNTYYPDKEEEKAVYKELEEKEKGR